MPEPAIKDDQTLYIDEEGNPVAGPDKGLMGTGLFAKNVTKVRKVVYDNGEVWTSINDGPLSYVKTDSQLATASRAEQKPETAPTFREDAGGNLQMWDANTGRMVPAPGMPQVTRSPEEIAKDRAAAALALAQARKYESDIDTPAERAARLALLQAQIAAQSASAGASGASARIAADKLAWEQARYPEETAYARGRDAVADLKAEQDRFAGNIRQLSGDYSNAWKEALQYQVAPGTQYIPGMETGGLMDQLQKKRGYTYNAEPWRLTEVAFDPWQAAIEMEKKNRK